MKTKLFFAMVVALVALVWGTAVASADGPHECINIATGEGVTSFDECGFGEPAGGTGAPPAIILDGVNVNGG